MNNRTIEQDHVNKQMAGLIENTAQPAPEEEVVKRQRYIKPRAFPHKHNAECCFDYVCHENECRILQKLICSECAPYVHPNHSIDSIDWYINYIREKIKRKDGAFKTLNHEMRQTIGDQRKKRMKYLKFMVKQYKKVERECRSIEDFTLQKINYSMSSHSRKEAFQKLIKILKLVKHPRLEQLSRSHPEFAVKQEDEQQQQPFQQDFQRLELQEQMSEIIDQMFLADEREREKIINARRSPSPQRNIRQLRFLGEKWERNMHRIAGATKRYTKRMLLESRMSVRISNTGLKRQVIDIDLKLEEDGVAPSVLQVLPLNEQLLLTVHPNEIRLWKYNNTTFQDFKPITTLKLIDLKHVCVTETRNEFLLLHGQQEIWAINTRNTGQIARIYQSPLPELKLSKLLVSGCSSMLFASGGCNQNGFYIICWGYATSSILRIVRHQYSFPHEGDLLTSYSNQHIFRCNRNSVDVFNVIEGNKIQTIVLSSIRDYIETSQVLRNFQESDSLCLSTNKGSFFIYSYDERLQDNNYKMVHSLTMGTLSIFHVFYQFGLAEEGFFLAHLENNETKVSFSDLNNKPLFRGIQFNDQVNCGKLDYQRTPWINQLILILGFASGMLRVIKFLKT